MASTEECITGVDSVTRELLQAENGTRNGYMVCALNVMAKEIHVASCWLCYIAMNMYDALHSVASKAFQ
jgi:hypothetical protein